MAKFTDQDVVRALRRAAEELLGRPLSDAEFDSLITEFNNTSGTPYERAIRSLSKFTGITEGRIEIRASASDNTNRIIMDLANTIANWVKNP